MREGWEIKKEIRIPVENGVCVIPAQTLKLGDEIAISGYINRCSDKAVFTDVKIIRTE